MREDIKELYLRVSELMGELSLKSSKNEINNIKRALHREGIVCVSLMCYNDCGNDKPSSWSMMKDSIIKHMELAEELGAEAIRLFAGKPANIANCEDF